jgi:hypothetical protein
MIHRRTRVVRRRPVRNSGKVNTQWVEKQTGRFVIAWLV